MPRPSVTRMVEDYVTLIWKAYEWPGGRPATTEMAEQLGVTASTVSANLKKLARDGYIDYEPYGQIVLTDVGRQIAVEIVRRHRIVESYLVEALGLTWDQVHDEADRLEHAVSDLVLERMNAALGSPQRDPHGDPIPDADGHTADFPSRRLQETAPGVEVEVVRVSDRSPELLRYLTDRGIVIGTKLQVRSISSAASAIAVRVGDENIELALDAADAIRVGPGLG
ncbi:MULTISPECIES: metal-dependent transcriptional regulator [Brevibacterium]|uniref:Manganese transport regulator n=1 Tax=Brevibacterium sediminis TaxID=1857024 RepID=A0A5C4X4C4_9MICO|nr:metal-dependent transcriptional regulator [Brevibacterium sediminis]TNM56817.1 metal-dependent transcriptional regulator [Brevibacterium sediminis]GGC33499.1 putative iron dependent transcriptional repressor FeoA [Brevibacterium sediminis]